MTVKELKRLLDFVPDNARVLIVGLDENENVTSTDACVVLRGADQRGMEYIELGRITEHEDEEIE